MNNSNRILALLAVAVPPSPLHAQGLTGQISGTVTDSGGGVMPGATVTVKNVGTNAARDTVSGRHQAELPQLLSHARVCEAFNGENHIKVVRRSDLIVKPHRGKATGNQAVTRQPSHCMREQTAGYV